MNDSKTYLNYNNSDIAKNIKNKYLRYKEWELTKIGVFDNQIDRPRSQGCSRT